MNTFRGKFFKKVKLVQLLSTDFVLNLKSGVLFLFFFSQTSISCIILIHGPARIVYHGQVISWCSTGTWSFNQHHEVIFKFVRTGNEQIINERPWLSIKAGRGGCTDLISWIKFYITPFSGQHLSQIIFKIYQLTKPRSHFYPFRHFLHC